MAASQHLETNEGKQEQQKHDLEQPWIHKYYFKLLTEWDLSQYAQIMHQHGWDDPQDWNEIDDDTFNNVLRFKSGHIAKFKRKLNALKKEKQSSSQNV